MTPGKVNLVIYQGATFSKEFVWQLGGTPVDLAGYTALMDIRADIDSETPIITLSTADDTIVLEEEAGKIIIQIAAQDTENLQFSRAVYDLELYSPDGIVTRLIQGSVTLSKEVTR